MVAPASIPLMNFTACSFQKRGAGARPLSGHKCAASRAEVWRVRPAVASRLLVKTRNLHCHDAVKAFPPSPLFLGGTGQSTIGTEPRHEPERTSQNRLAGRIVIPAATPERRTQDARAVPYCRAHCSSKETCGGPETPSVTTTFAIRSRAATCETRYAGVQAVRDIGLGANGVGPTPLTWPGLQDRADALGGCWNYGVQFAGRIQPPARTHRRAACTALFWNSGSESLLKRS